MKYLFASILALALTGAANAQCYGTCSPVAAQFIAPAQVVVQPAFAQVVAQPAFAQVAFTPLVSFNRVVVQPAVVNRVVVQRNVIQPVVVNRTRVVVRTR